MRSLSVLLAGMDRGVKSRKGRTLSLKGESASKMLR